MVGDRPGQGTLLPRFVVAAPASGHGKTTVATGLMAALARSGHTVSGHKVGPDYIDPGYHALATGRPGRNLDPHLVGEERLVPLLRHGAAGADVAVIEGVMGLYDGRLGGDGFASTAHVAAVTSSPVILVVDISHASRSVAAVVHGMAHWGDVEVAGVVLNKAGSARHAAEVRRAIGDALPVLGVLHRDDGIEAPSRHLGLVPAAERDDAAAALDRLAGQVAEHIDLAAVLEIARSAPALTAPAWEPAAEVRRGCGAGARIAVAGGRAFTFRYAETTELLRATGAEVVEFDPLTDPALPEGTTGLYLGGGFPEVHAPGLSGNDTLRADIARRVAGGLPTVAECAGLLYLCRSVQTPDGPVVPMVGAIDADAVWAPRLTLAYRTATAPAESVVAGRDQTVTGHEFHRTTLTVPDGTTPAWHYAGAPAAQPAGVATASLHASYLHTHWAGHPELAERFATAAARHTPLRSVCVPDTAPARRAPAPDLRHHGDREVGDGLVDFAVNVYDGPRPGWLDKAVADSLDDLGSYPDPQATEQALAARHGRTGEEVLATAGAAEAFTLIARMRAWRRPVVVHPQFTEPDVALRGAGHRPGHVLTHAEDGFALDPATVPESADLVVLGNPTNPTGVRHPRATVQALLRPGRLVVVDEAFCDDGVESHADHPGHGPDDHGPPTDGLLIVRSLTKLWTIPGLRAGYLLGDAAVIAEAAAVQPPWSVSTPALAALRACTTEQALAEAHTRAATLATWRDHLLDGLRALDLPHAGSQAPFVLARPGHGVHGRLRERGLAVRRADTFPGLDGSWIRIAARPPAITDRLLEALSGVRSEALQ